MPADIARLIECFVRMKRIYQENPNKAVRGQGFIHELHTYCVNELIKLGINKERIVEEAKLFGSHKTKDVDVAYVDPINGPLIIIGVRSQMSSVGKNILTYYEEIIGDCISLHDRFPMAVNNYVYLLPVHSLKAGLESESINLERYEQLYKLITNRGDWRNTKDKYEHFAFLKVDFDTDPPTLLDTIPELMINNFFDKIKDTYNERNMFLQLE